MEMIAWQSPVIGLFAVSSGRYSKGRTYTQKQYIENQIKMSRFEKKYRAEAMNKLKIGASI